MKGLSGQDLVMQENLKRGSGRDFLVRGLGGGLKTCII